MIIGGCGFVGTGSSVVTDFLREFGEVDVMDKFEFVLSHFPDGLEDLDFQLNQHCAKYASSAVAIERFQRLFWGEMIYPNEDPNIRKALTAACDRFIESITQSSWIGMGAVDHELYSGRLYRNQRLNRFMPRAVLKAKRIVSSWSKKPIAGYPLHTMCFSMQPDGFEVSAQKLIREVLSISGADLGKKVALDQPFSGNHPCLSFKYFDDPRAIIVDRDPRDLFLVSKNYYRLNGTGYQIPADVEEFVSYYRRLRECRFYDQNTENVLSINFEDMIYRYEQTTKKIIDFCELDTQKRGKPIFQPEVSVRNTQLIRRYPDEKNAIEFIENKLPEYLYDFESFGDVDVTGNMILFNAVKK